MLLTPFGTKQILECQQRLARHPRSGCTADSWQNRCTHERTLSLHTQEHAQKGEAQNYWNMKNPFEHYRQEKTRKGHFASRDRQNDRGAAAGPVMQRETSCSRGDAGSLNHDSAVANAQKAGDLETYLQVPTAKHGGKVLKQVASFALLPLRKEHPLPCVHFKERHCKEGSPCAHSIFQEALLSMRILLLQVTEGINEDGKKREQLGDPRHHIHPWLLSSEGFKHVHFWRETPNHSEYREQFLSLHVMQIGSNKERSFCARQFDELASDNTACLEECCRTIAWTLHTQRCVFPKKKVSTSPHYLLFSALFSACMYTPILHSAHLSSVLHRT